jgi:hypothetical protein
MSKDSNLLKSLNVQTLAIPMIKQKVKVFVTQTYVNKRGRVLMPSTYKLEKEVTTNVEQFSFFK